jgi:hypothetical protein
MMNFLPHALCPLGAVNLHPVATLDQLQAHLYGYLILLGIVGVRYGRKHKVRTNGDISGVETLLLPSVGKFNVCLDIAANGAQI